MPAATNALLTLGLPPAQPSHEKLQAPAETWLFWTWHKYCAQSLCLQSPLNNDAQGPQVRKEVSKPINRSCTAGRGVLARREEVCLERFCHKPNINWVLRLGMELSQLAVSQLGSMNATQGFARAGLDLGVWMPSSREGIDANSGLEK